MFDRSAADDLMWLPSHGIGYLKVTANPYDAAYFDKYRGYAATGIGERLNDARCAMLHRHWDCARGPIVDVGIGCGTFVESCPGRHEFGSVRGFDINPSGVSWLRARGLFHDPTTTPCAVACFWDSLEHIDDPATILDNVSSLVLVSLPIFRNLAHVLRSKHFRPDEHCWYFTERGFVEFMGAHGWLLVERNNDETAIGREDIESFAFVRDA